MHVFSCPADDPPWAPYRATYWAAFLPPATHSDNSFFTPGFPAIQEPLAGPTNPLDVSADVGNGGKPGPSINKQRKTRRGGGKGKNNSLQFSLLGNNVNGIRGKLNSLKNAVKHFKKPSCITIQESKLKSQNIKIPGYQLFVKN